MSDHAEEPRPIPPVGGWAYHTPELDQWSAAFVAAAAELKDVVRSREAAIETRGGGSYSYSYADLAAIMTEIRPILAAAGLAVSQAVERDSRGDVLVWTTLLHASGQRVTWQPLSMPGGNTPQDAGSAITYARRYAVLACLGLATEDDDGAQATKAASGAAGARGGASGESSGPVVERISREEAEELKAKITAMTEAQRSALVAEWTAHDPMTGEPWLPTEDGKPRVGMLTTTMLPAVRSLIRRIYDGPPAPPAAPTAEPETPDPGPDTPEDNGGDKAEPETAPAAEEPQAGAAPSPHDVGTTAGDVAEARAQIEADVARLSVEQVKTDLKELNLPATGGAPAMRMRLANALIVSWMKEQGLAEPSEEPF